MLTSASYIKNISVGPEIFVDYRQPVFGLLEDVLKDYPLQTQQFHE